MRRAGTRRKAPPAETGPALGDIVRHVRARGRTVTRRRRMTDGTLKPVSVRVVRLADVAAHFGTDGGRLRRIVGGDPRLHLNVGGRFDCCHDPLIELDL